MTNLHPTFTTGLVFPIFYQSKECLLFKTGWKLKNLSISMGRGTSAIFFWVFQLFQIISHQSRSKWPIMANFAKKWLGLSSKWPILVKFAGFSIFCPKYQAQHWILDWPSSSQQGSFFEPSHEKSQGVLCSMISKLINEFLNFFKLYHTREAQNDPINANFAKKVS